MKINLTEKELEFICHKVVIPLEQLKAQIFLFGSRVKLNNSKYSDIDLLIKADSYPSSLIQKVREIEEELIESNFPYKIDFVFDSDLAQGYRQDVEKTMIRICAE